MKQNNSASPRMKWKDCGAQQPTLSRLSSTHGSDHSRLWKIVIPAKPGEPEPSWFQKNASEQRLSEIPKFGEKSARAQKDVGTCPRSEEHTSELQSRSDIVCR